MASRTVVVEREAPRAAEMAQPVAGVAFTWIMVILCGWLLGGLYLDGWAHNHEKLDINLLSPSDLSRTFTPPGLPSILTTWHAPYYTGLLAVGGFLGVVLMRDRGTGYPWRRALPAGYGLSLLGVMMVIAGGVGELIWPVDFSTRVVGVLRSQALAGLLGPFRLLQAVGASLVVSGPLRAAWLRADLGPRPAWVTALPMLLSLAFLLSLLTYVTQFAHPFVDPWATLSFLRRSLHSYRYGQFIFGESMGVLSIMLQTGVLMGVVLLVLQRWALPPGSLTLVFTLNAVLMGVLGDHYAFILSAAAAGLVADLLLRHLKPPLPRVGDFRFFAFAVPALYYLFYFLVLTRMVSTEASWGVVTRGLPGPPLEGIGWSVHLWLGTILTAGAVGWLLSYLVMPPVVPAREPYDHGGARRD